MTGRPAGNDVLIPQADGYQIVAPRFVADFDGLAQCLVQAQVGAVFFQRGGGGEGPDLAAVIAEAQGFDFGQVAVGDFDDDASDCRGLAVAGGV